MSEDSLQGDTLVTNHEAIAGIDFKARLKQAAESAPLVTLTGNGGSVEDVEEIETNLGGDRKFDDEEIVVLPFGLDDNQVVTDNPDHYRLLLRQVWEFLPYRDPSDIEEIIENCANHEFEHGDMLKQVSPSSTMHYGIGISRVKSEDGTEENVFYPFMIPQGRMRKIDLAMIQAAPTKLSESDRVSIGILGYKNAEEVVERYNSFTK